MSMQTVAVSSINKYESVKDGLAVHHFHLSRDRCYHQLLVHELVLLWD